MPIDNYLDIGSGTGNFALELMRSININTATLVDHSQEMLAICQKKLNLANLENKTHICCQDYLSWLKTACNQPSQYDLITAAFTLDHISDDEEFINILSMIKQLLTNNGVFVMIEKAANQKDPLSSSWLSFRKMIAIRKKKMVELQLKSQQGADQFEQHILTEDFLRPPSHLLSLANTASLTCDLMSGLRIDAVDTLTESTYYSQTIQAINFHHDTHLIDQYAYSPIILFLN
jgi:ubiquinone/menaquinone biosynthesis C-methylase UbiE